MQFYPMLVSLHLIPVLFAIGASLLYAWDRGNPVSPETTRSFVIAIITIVSSLHFLAWVTVGPWRRGKMNRLIETQRATWLAVFEIPPSRQQGDIVEVTK
jgi:hypothetical protein